MDGKKYIRPMTGTDLVEVLAIERGCYPHPWSARQFLDELENGAAEILVCEIEQQICGYICFWLIAGEMQILNIATAPQLRRSGVAAALLDQAFSRGQHAGLTAAWLEVRVGNGAAIELYRRNGFTASGIRKKYYRDGEDALLMVREFTSQ